ncbi:MAG: stage 0 sporulation family protein [Johnsonella sp.]|nr:stage 0 sporulation family protein [Johnsonella sp.]
MTRVVGVRFREVGKIYYFDPGEIDLSTGEKVIVDTSRGLECGTVVLGNREVEDKNIVSPLRQVKRKAYEEDIKRLEYNRSREAEAFKLCKKKIIEHGLEMKLISAEYTFDNTKLLFYFTSEGRVDFRDLVKDLALIFKLRIELRQVGVRDETRMVGGIGTCGRPLCCHSYLSDFAPVSIKMAKEQNLSLNPQKISGVCGRLMCCLKNEAETYEYLNNKLPREGDEVETAEGIGIVSSVNVLRQKVKILIARDNENKELMEYDVKEVKIRTRKKPSRRLQESDEEMAEEPMEANREKKAEPGENKQGSAPRKKSRNRKKTPQN